MSNSFLPQDMSTYSVLHRKQPPLPDSHTFQWLLQQSQKQSPQPSSPGIMIHSPLSSSPDSNLAHDYSNYTQESGDDHGSWMSTQMCAPGLQILVNAPPLSSSPMYPEHDWNDYHNYGSPSYGSPCYGSPNEANSNTNYIMNNYTPNCNNSLVPYSTHPRTPSSLPQLSSAGSDPSLSPLYGASRLGTPTTPGSTTQSFMPSPTLSEVNHTPQDYKLDPGPLFSHQQQMHMFREAPLLPREGAGPFIPQLMYRPHTTSDRKRYVEDVGLEAPIYFYVDSHSNQCGISLQDALHSRVKYLVNREQVVFEGRGPSVSIRLEWPGYRQWSKQIPTKDFRSPPGPITTAKLAKNVAKCVQRFIQDRKSQEMEDGSNPRWRIGDRPDDIKFNDLMLVSIHHVSLGSWQPHLRLRVPRSDIPIQSSPIGSSMISLGWAR